MVLADSKIGHIGRLTIVVLFLEIHIDDAAGPHFVHVRSIESRNLGESARLNFVATIFGEEDGNIVAFKLCSTLVETRLGKARVAAPRVDVVTPEVDGVVTVATIKVGSQVIANLGIVVGGISDANSSVVLGLDIGLHVTNSSLDKSTGIGVGIVVGDFIASKETHDVGVAGKAVDDGGVASVEIIVPSRVGTNDGVAGRGQIGDNVDASIVQHLHALVVVGRRVDGVDTDGVGSHSRQVGDISLTLGSICQRVDVVIGGVGRCRGAVGAIFLFSTCQWLQQGQGALGADLGRRCLSCNWAQD